MSKLETIIDFGSKGLRLGVFDKSSKCIYSSKTSINNSLEKKNLEKSLNKLIRDAEKNLSTHLIDINVLYDSPNIKFIDLSIKKSFDQPTSTKLQYQSLIDEANYIISENNFKDRVIHIILNKIIADEGKIIHEINDNVSIKSLILEIKFICLNKSLVDEISQKLKKNNLNILNFYCSSYVKSIFFKKSLENKNNLIFLDIGFERTSALFFRNNRFLFLNSIPIGGNNITKDISKILKLNIDYAEDLKIKFNKEENEIFFNKKSQSDINLYKEIRNKNISIKLLKQIIEARVDEIIDLAVIKNTYFEKIKSLEKPSIIFIGNGSKLLSNSFNLESKKAFSELIFFEDNESKICRAGIFYDKSDERFLIPNKKRLKKRGFFENFFNIFSR